MRNNSFRRNLLVLFSGLVLLWGFEGHPKNRYEAPSMAELGEGLDIDMTGALNTSSAITIFQETTITGLVTDTDGTPLLGATVQVEGTLIGVTTDFDGNYVINVPESGSNLIFSYIGFIQKIVPIAGNSKIDVQLEEDANTLDEVVVTALGIERNKKTLSYAVSEIEGDQLANQAEADVLRALSGKVAGVNISGSGGAAGSSTNIIIRGNNSATGNNQPLFVVDGIPFDNSTTSTLDLAGA